MPQRIVKSILPPIAADHFLSKPLKLPPPIRAVAGSWQRCLTESPTTPPGPMAAAGEISDY
jgi:hypothetical protein